jgi:hypothetical protein
MMFKVGDKVTFKEGIECRNNWVPSGTIGEVRKVWEGGDTVEVSVDKNMWIAYAHQITHVPTSPVGPVRTVTRKEIVPGKYGIVKVASTKCIGIPFYIHTTAELRAAAATLLEIAEALEEEE